MNKHEAKQWVNRELAKVTNKEQAEMHIASFKRSRDNFFNTPAGIESAQREPHARKARFELAEKVSAMYGIDL